MFGLKQYANLLFKKSLLTEEQHDVCVLLLGDASILRHALTCPKGDGQEYCKHACLRGECDECSNFVLLKGFFGDVASHFFPLAVNDLTPRNMRKEKHEEIDDDAERQVPGVGFISYPRMIKTKTHRKDKSEKTQKEFACKSVPIRDFWEDFIGFWKDFVAHHDRSKWQGRQFAQLKDFDTIKSGEFVEHVPRLPKRHVRMVIDYLQRHTLQRGPKQTQQEYFAQMGMTLCVVSLTFHLDDLKNISDADKLALAAGFKAQQRPALIREEHFYCTHDPERGQPAVQYMLQDIKDYLEGDGRWAATVETCTDHRRPAHDYLQSRPATEKAYYRGRGAGSQRHFQGLHVWSDGCSADFKCATLLLWLSKMRNSFAFMLVWNWFETSHGKTDECDAGGGSYKGKLDRVEVAALVTLIGFFDRAMRIVEYSRANLETPGSWDAQGYEGEVKDDVVAYFKRTDGTGVWRRWYHHIPAAGKGSIVRRIAEAKLSADCGSGGNINLEDDSNVPFPIKGIHRAVTTGFSNSLKVSCRSCYTCAQCKIGNVLNCENGAADALSDKPWLDGGTSREFKVVVIEAKAEQECQYTSSPAKDVTDEVFKNAEKDHILAIESQSEAEPMWLVRVVRKRGCVGPAAQFEDWGVKYLVGKSERALEVIRLFPSSSRSTNTYCDDTQKRRFLVPTMLLRHADLTPWMEEKQNNSGGRNRSRAAVEAVNSAGPAPEVYYELSAEKRREVALLCREFA